MSIAVIQIEKYRVCRGEESRWVFLKTVDEPIVKITPKRVHTRSRKFDRATGDDIVTADYFRTRWYRAKLLEIKQS